MTLLSSSLALPAAVKIPTECIPTSPAIISALPCRRRFLCYPFLFSLRRAAVVVLGREVSATIGRGKDMVHHNTPFYILCHEQTRSLTGLPFPPVPGFAIAAICTPLASLHHPLFHLLSYFSTPHETGHCERWRRGGLSSVKVEVGVEDGGRWRDREGIGEW